MLFASASATGLNLGTGNGAVGDLVPEVVTTPPEASTIRVRAATTGVALAVVIKQVLPDDDTVEFALRTRITRGILAPVTTGAFTPEGVVITI